MPHFRTLRVSDPRFERDHLRHLTVKSPALRGRGDILLYYPPPRGPMPLVILLHGVYGSSWSWAMGGGVHLTAQALIDAGRISPMAIAMPSDGLWGDGSGYVRQTAKDFEAWIVDDVPAAVAEIAPDLAETPRFIAGLSMGGFGALRLGALYADRFQGIAGHSAITDPAQLAAFVEEPVAAYLGSDDRSVLAAMRAARGRLPPIRFDCGLSDPLLEPNRTLHQQLTNLGISHHYEEFPGEHHWPYWERHIVDTLRFFDGIVRGEAQ